MKKNRILLTSEQRSELERFSKTGVHSARLITRAKILLLLDTSVTGTATTFSEISERLDVSNQTINNVRNSFFAAESISTFMQRKKRITPPIAPKITGEVEARIIALACSEVPEGFSKWTVRLIAEKSVEVNLGDSVSQTSVHRILKKHNFNLT